MAGYLLLCPGQGSQHPAMLDFALATQPGRDAIAEASTAVGFDLAARVRAGDDLFEPVFAQACIVATAIATWHALRDHLPSPAAVAGYSVGEVSAWACAGTWSMSEAMALVRQRASAMAAASPPGCAMLAVTGIGRDAIDLARGESVHVAIEVASDHHILAGPGGNVRATGDVLAAQGATLHALPVTVPSHTPLLASAAESLRITFRAAPGREPQFPVLRGVDGRTMHARRDAADALADAVRRTISWRAVLREVAEQGIAAALELPPGAALARMMGTQADAQARAVADFRSVEGVASWLARVA